MLKTSRSSALIDQSCPKYANNVVPSWDRRGGRAIKRYRRRHPSIGTDGVVSPDSPGVTTPSALSLDASRYFLDAQPPLLSEEGTRFGKDTDSMICSNPDALWVADHSAILFWTGLVIDRRYSLKCS